MKNLRILLLALALTLPVLFASAQKTASTTIDKITNAYLGVKNALATGNGTVAESKAKELFDVLSADADKGLNPDEQKVMNSYLPKLQFDSRHISQTTDVNHQREHFASLSKNLYEVLKGIKANTATLYMQYCPMKKAYWLSESSAIKNPYYNDKMMSACGSNKVTLPAAK